MTDEDVSRAVDDAVNPDRLLAGEDPTTRYVEDARHWVAVYGELTTFKRSLVASTEARASQMLPEAAKELRETDLPILRAEAERLNRRLEFWGRRLSELSRRSERTADDEQGLADC